jgi:hypothetical protein
MLMNDKNLIIPCFLLLTISLSFIPLVYADVVTIDTDKHTFYVVGETITFTGTTDTAFNQVIIEVREPPDENGIKNLVTAQGTISSSDFEFSDSIEVTSSKFNKHGIYSVIAYLSSQTAEEGITIFFDFSLDGSPVIPSAFTPPIELKQINDLTVNELSNLVFTASLVNPYTGNDTLTYSLENNPPSGATINPSSGSFSWTPTEAQGPGSYTFDVVVKAGVDQDRKTLTITVNEVAIVPEPEPEPEPKKNIPDFVETEKGAQYYLDRYNNEAAYKAWFDSNFPDYTIQQAIELAIPNAFSEPEPSKNVPNFIDPKKGAQYYLDRYNKELSYKAWFDSNFPDYTIQQAIELAIPGSFPEPEPEKEIAPFVDPNQDPQYYIDRYNSEPTYKAWFDENFPDQTIYEAVGLEPPKTGICGTGTHFVDGVCIADRQGGGCLIATAAYGSEMSEQVQFLREMRDNTVLGTESGYAFMETFNSIYYSFSPTIADLERQSTIFKNTVQIAITPLLSSLSILSLADIDSEEEMLGYGIGVILLNLGVYVASPAIAVIKVRKYIIN